MAQASKRSALRCASSTFGARYIARSAAAFASGQPIVLRSSSKNPVRGVIGKAAFAVVVLVTNAQHDARTHAMRAKPIISSLCRVSAIDK